ncbi:MAG: hypothetical protein ACLUD0_21690 [Eubacterium ramulus]
MNGMLERADQIDLKELLDEKLGYPAPLSYDDWVEANHYQKLNDAQKTGCIVRSLATSRA